MKEITEEQWIQAVDQIKNLEQDKAVRRLKAICNRHSTRIKEEIPKPFFLFFDTETTGLPKNYKAPHTDLDNWTRMIQLGWQVYTEHGQLLKEKEYIIKPEGFTIPKEASDIHGISQKKASNRGKALSSVLTLFQKDLAAAVFVVCHNVNFDQKIHDAEVVRCFGVNHNRWVTKLVNEKNTICTMESTKELIGIKNKYGFKFPSLQDLHKHCFRKGFDDAHDALVDVKATARCFFHLVSQGFEFVKTN